ncbi:SOSS complex subunit B-like protein [Pyrus ussuriensis x Pyrus communis]|uniref:SOSS complex subunit B-like protein n=1 Tax=Pyrus ussuriensis x Pyrus communis TaxID=2448454 RepID=A0A5N5GSH4_9ROSA|nr:SOSS complex subunit B-like protein [Pyrus ussuriensis x Pyrus communis]
MFHDTAIPLRATFPNLSCHCFSFHLLLPPTTNTSSQAENKTRLALAVDETAVVHFQLWGDECNAFEPGDIVHLSNGIFSYDRSKLLLRQAREAKFRRLGLSGLFTIKRFVLENKPTPLLQPILYVWFYLALF